MEDADRARAHTLSHHPPSMAEAGQAIEKIIDQLFARITSHIVRLTTSGRTRHRALMETLPLIRPEGFSASEARCTKTARANDISEIPSISVGNSEVDMFGILTETRERPLPRICTATASSAGHSENDDEG
jgi:hypothetical protein